MMPNVPDGNICEGANRKRKAACRSETNPRVVVQIPEKIHVSAPKQQKFFRQIGERAPVKIAVFDVAVLLETFDRRFIRARNPQRAVSE